MSASERPPIRKSQQSLEAAQRSQANWHIIVRAVKEVDVIADFGSNSDRAGQCFETSARR